MKTSRQLLSAGGVLVRRDRRGTRVLVLHHAGHDEWRLPKGKLKEGESAAEAAEREVLEETGLDLQAGRYLGVTDYRYPDPAGGGNVRKLVYFFEMDPADADITLEPTFDDAQWLPPQQAVERLTWNNEREMVHRATQWR